MCKFNYKMKDFINVFDTAMHHTLFHEKKMKKSSFHLYYSQVAHFSI